MSSCRLLVVSEKEPDLSSKCPAAQDVAATELPLECLRASCGDDGAGSVIRKADR